MYGLYSSLWSCQIALHLWYIYRRSTYSPWWCFTASCYNTGGNIKVIDSDPFAAIWGLEMVVSIPQDHSRRFKIANNSMAWNGCNSSSSPFKWLWMAQALNQPLGLKDVGFHRRPPCPTCIARLIPAMKRDLSSLPSQCLKVRWRRNCSFAENVFCVFCIFSVSTVVHTNTYVYIYI